MSFLDVLLWISVVYFAVFVFFLVGFAIVTNGFQSTSHKFSDRVFNMCFVFSLFWLPFLMGTLFLWWLCEVVES